MLIVLIEPVQAIREALAMALIRSPVTAVQTLASLDELTNDMLTSSPMVIAFTNSAVRNRDTLAQCHQRGHEHRWVWLASEIVERNQTFCCEQGIDYLSLDCSLAELRVMLIGPEPPSPLPTGCSRSAALATLTPREHQVLLHVAKGYSVRECAAALGLSHSTVDNHKTRMMAKLNIHKSIELVYLAVREGLVSLDDPAS